MSIIYNKNKIVEGVIRASTYILFIKYNKNGVLDGRSVLLNYENKSVIYAIYKNGNLVDKK
jgi:hypothetical protein